MINKFGYICDLVYKESGIVLGQDKTYLLEARLNSFLNELGLESFEELELKLRNVPFGDLHVRIVEALTTNETSFFRDKDPFEAFKNTLVPEVLKNRPPNHVLRIWCGASSSGQEPYSIAMIIRESFPQLLNGHASIIATDLSTEILDYARKGQYTNLEVSRGLPPELKDKYFEKQGNYWQISPLLQNMIEYKKLNLIETWPSMPTIDIVFLRNVLIYFDTETKKSILGKIRQILHPDGFLFLGKAETTMAVDSSYERRKIGQTICYRPKEAVLS